MPKVLTGMDQKVSGMDAGLFPCPRKDKGFHRGTVGVYPLVCHVCETW